MRDSVLMGILASQDRRSRRCAKRVRGECVLKAHAFVRQSIQSGSLDIRIAVTTERLLCLVIRHDQQDVRLRRGAYRQTQSHQPKRQYTYFIQIIFHYILLNCYFSTRCSP